MNRYKLNQILETLLLPLVDSKQGEQDMLLSCFQEYVDFQENSKNNGYGAKGRNKKNNKYRNEKKNLVKYLVERNHWHVKAVDDVEQICDVFYSMEEVEEYIDSVCKVYNEYNIENGIENFYLLSRLPLIACSLITYRDGIAAIRPWIDKDRDKVDIFKSGSVFNKIEIWNLLNRLMSPDILIAVAAVEHGLGPEALYEQDYNLFLADKLLVKSLQNGMAENHIHFNVGIDYQIVWLGYVNLSFVEKLSVIQSNKDKYKRILVALFRCIAALFLSDQRERDFTNFLEDTFKGNSSIKKILKNLFDASYEEEIDGKSLDELSRLYWKVVNEDVFYESDYLMEKVYSGFSEYKTSSEFILLYQSYEYIKYHQKDTVFIRLFLQYIRLKNEFYHGYHERHVLQGLNYFQEYYGKSKRTARIFFSAKELMLEIFRSQAKQKYLRKLEIRIVPEVGGNDMMQFSYRECRDRIIQELYEQLEKIFFTYRRFILESTLGVKETKRLLKKEGLNQLTECDRKYIYDNVRKATGVNIPNVGIVFSFLKNRFLENISRYYCWKRVLVYEHSKYTYSLVRRYFLQNTALAIEEIRQTIPKIDEYIVGIDAASDENAEEPWMFASAYKMIRSHNSTKPISVFAKGNKVEFNRIQNIGFTFHVGEDFRHILSGLRHVDEVLEEFSYKPGDRLGHALVLGIDIREWIRNNEVVAIPLLEYLEDWLWVWGVLVESEIGNAVSRDAVEDKIMEIAKEIHFSEESIPVRILYGEYKAKFRCDHAEIAEKSRCWHLDEKDRFCRWDEAKGNKEKNIKSWTENRILLTNYCPVFSKKNKVELVTVKMADLELFQSLQEYLIRKVEKKGVYIETNPTSNLTIGDFEQMSRHPIFSLNQNSRSLPNHTMITINSDDPLVFNTNVENEFAYIYYAAEAEGMSKEEILEWIDRIRVHGLNSSFVQVEKGKLQILLEIERILKEIREHRISGN